MSRSTPLVVSSAQPETPYSLVGVDLPCLLSQVAAGGVSPAQAEAQLQLTNRPWVRGLRAVLVSLPGLLFFGVGVFLLRYAWLINADARQFEGRSRQTTGTVVALRHDFTKRRSGYAPVFTYRVGGKVYQATSDLYTSPAGYSVGETVTVRYRPDQPGAGKLSSFTDRWLLLLIAAGAGSLLTLLGIFIISGLITPAGSRSGPTPTRFRDVLTLLATKQLTVEEARQQLQPEPSVTRARRSPLVGVVGLLLFGTVLFLSLRQLNQSARLLFAGQRIEGTVVGFVHSKGSGAAPLIRYRVAGQDYECVGSYSTTIDQKPGDLVTVLYNPDQPAEAKVRSYDQLVGGPLFGLLMTLLIGGFVVGLPLYRWYRARTSP